MKRILRGVYVLSTLLAVSWPVSVQADVLELRSGQKLEGQYAGGSRDEIRFQVGSQTLRFPITEVAKIAIGTARQEDFRRAGREALRQLKALASAVEGGITYHDYAPRVTDAKIKVDQFLDEWRPSPHPLFNEHIADSLGFYLAASTAWNLRVSNAGGSQGPARQLLMINLSTNPYIRKCAPLQEMLLRRRSEPDYNKYGFPEAVADGVHIMLDTPKPLWECARNSTIDAEKGLDR